MMKRTCILIGILILIIAMASRYWQIKLHRYSPNVEIINHSDTMSLHMNDTNVYEMPLAGLASGQVVHINLNIMSGTARLKLFDENDHEVERSLSDKKNENIFHIKADGDYRLRIDVIDADYLISVMLYDEADI